MSTSNNVGLWEVSIFTNGCEALRSDILDPKNAKFIMVRGNDLPDLYDAMLKRDQEDFRILSERRNSLQASLNSVVKEIQNV